MLFLLCYGNAFGCENCILNACEWLFCARNWVAGKNFFYFYMFVYQYL